MGPEVLSPTDREELDEISEELEKRLPPPQEREERGGGGLELPGRTSGLTAKTGLWVARNWKAFPWQAELLEEITLPPVAGGVRYYNVNAGRGVGKTTLAPEIIWEAATMEWDDDLGPPNVKLAADTYEHAQKIWSKVWDESISVLSSLVHSWDKERNIIFLRSVSQPSEKGATIQMLSADDPHAMTGHNDMTVAVFDEAQFIKNESWLQFLPCMNIRHAVLIAFGVCEGAGRYRSMSFKGQQRFDWPEYKTIRVPSTRNPYFTPAMDDLARRENTPEKYMNLYQVKWREEGGALFENIDGCIVDRGRVLGLKNGKPLVIHKALEAGDYTAGLDIGKSRDYMACVILDRNTGKMVAILRANKRTYTFLESLVARFLLAYRPIVYVDVTGMGQAPYAHVVRFVKDQERLAQERGEGITGATETSRKVRFVECQLQKESKAQLIDGLALKLIQERVRFPYISELVAEMEVFEKRILPSGTVTYQAPEGLHDDLVIATALAAQGLPAASKVLVPGGAQVTRVVRGWQKMAVSKSGW